MTPKIGEKKRARSINFSEAEEELLLRLALNRKDVVECKVSDTKRNEDKILAWEEIAAEFNASCLNTVRTSIVLKKKYENIKKYIRQSVSKERISRKATGGGRGPDEWRPKSEAMAELREVIALSVDGLQSICDDDNDNEVNAGVVPKDTVMSGESHADLETASNEGYEVEYLEDLFTNNEVVQQKEAENDAVDGSSAGDPVVTGSPGPSINSAEKRGDMWEKYSPAMLKRPISNALKAKPKRPKVSVELDLKKKLLERNEEMMEEVHRLDVQKRKVELESAHICLQTDKMKLQVQQLRYQHMTEEHAMRMKILHNTFDNNTGTSINSCASMSE